MDKPLVFDALREKLRRELEAAVGASRDAADYATDEESRAESKYDTQGLEASYLAAGQASLARSLADAVTTLEALRAELTAPRESVLRGALVQCNLGRHREWFYLSPVGGGETLDIDGTEVTVITAQSPIGAAITGKAAGAKFKLPNGADGSIARVV
ncbi:MAG: transcription elongation factor GreAB [Verrucomicrobiota bacterium JB024]|nr:transcription elongation factor GreAB [Verrucomicrobiota bacterium JB024]